MESQTPLPEPKFEATKVVERLNQRNPTLVELVVAELVAEHWKQLAHNWHETYRLEAEAHDKYRFDVEASES